MLSAAQIVKVTQKITKNRALHVKVLKVKKSLQFSDRTYYMVECRTMSDRHMVEIVLYTAKKLTTRNLGRSKMWVTCTCGHHVFRCEHALWLKGSSSLIHTAGIEPGETGLRVNPLNIPWCCKHVIKVLQNIPRMKKPKSGKMPLKLAMKMEMNQIEDRIPEKKKKKKKKKTVVKIKKKKVNKTKLVVKRKVKKKPVKKKVRIKRKK